MRIIFLSLVTDSEAEVQVQGKVIRRLTIVGLRPGIKDDSVSQNLGLGRGVTTSLNNISKIRSLTILGEVNWMPPLPQFKFLRVLVLRSYYCFGIKTDLTGISQLAQLRYLKVEGKTVGFFILFSWEAC